MEGFHSCGQQVIFFFLHDELKQVFSSFVQINGLAHMHASKHLPSWQTLAPLFSICETFPLPCAHTMVRQFLYLCIFIVLAIPHVPKLRDGTSIPVHVDSSMLATQTDCDHCPSIVTMHRLLLRQHGCDTHSDIANMHQTAGLPCQCWLALSVLCYSAP